ncbi:MAG: hypothetical protein IKW85_05005 [Muribaculaceae bacterium]|nr:hypothetical protein [Muribaculaceae bacterium]
MTNEEKSALSTQFSRFLWSSVLITLSGCLGNVVDGIIVGNLIGQDGVSAINLSKPVAQLYMTINLLLGMGASMIVGNALGKKDKKRATYVFTLAVIINFVIGLCFTLVGLTANAPVAHLLCNNELLLKQCEEYLLPMLLGAPAYMMMWTFSAMISVDGSPRLASMAIIIDNAVNLMLDLVFIQWFGWGITGSSMATVVGHLVGIAIMLHHFRYKNNNLCLTLKHDQPEFLKIVSQGAPLAVASICLTLLLLTANTTVLSTMGRTGIFAFSVCMNLLQIYNLFVAGTCRTLQSLGAIQAGTGNNEAFSFVVHKSLRFITTAMGITCLLVLIWPQIITMLFGAEDAASASECNYALRIFALSFIPFCYIYVLMIIYKLYGQHSMALFISFALSLTVIPVLWIMAKWMPQHIWYSYLIAYVIEAVVIFALHKSRHIRFELKS